MRAMLTPAWATGEAPLLCLRSCRLRAGKTPGMLPRVQAASGWRRQPITCSFMVNAHNGPGSGYPSNQSHPVSLTHRSSAQLKYQYKKIYIIIIIIIFVAHSFSFYFSFHLKFYYYYYYLIQGFKNFQTTIINIFVYFFYYYPSTNFGLYSNWAPNFVDMA
jgi:hypothetical protein